jgi:hypothetical protein
LTLDNDTVTGNNANAVDGGQGIGGVYNLGTLNLVGTNNLTNRATTSNDDIYGRRRTSLRAEANQSSFFWAFPFAAICALDSLYPHERGHGHPERHR